MKKSLENNEFNTSLEMSDWRYSASVLGLIKYLKHHGLSYKIEEDILYYNSEDITEDRYLQFIEKHYGEALHHNVIENILSKNEITDIDVKIVNEKLTANTVMKKVFGKIKFDKTNSEEILKILNENRNLLIKETFRTKKDMYANYANTNQLLNESQNYCRLVGYYIDAAKKGKSTAYKFDTNSFVGNDEIEFDFIPLAFSGDFEAFFINKNYSIKTLETENGLFKDMIKKIRKQESEEADSDKLSEKAKKVKKSREILFESIIETSEFIDRDVEVIIKDRDKSYFETMYLRKESIDLLKFIGESGNGIDYKALNTSIKVTNDYYINVHSEAMNNILNNLVMDNLIDVLLKEGSRSYLIDQLIKINILIRRNEAMKDELKGAYICARLVVETFEKNKQDNKRESYRQKLTSAIVFKDYDRFNQILLQLSNYSGVEFGFAYDLFGDFEENKELAYTFVNGLVKREKKNNEDNKGRQ